MIIIQKLTIDRWWIIFDKNQNIINHGELPGGNVLSAPNEVTIYTDKEEWKQILTDNGIEITEEI